MKTKTKILKISRETFNKHGIAKVSLRMISETMGISPGNLTYHFKKKEELEEALYFELVSHFEKGFEEMQNESIGLKSPFAFVEQVFDLMFEYRFFFMDFSQFMRKNPKLFSHYQKLSVHRKTQFIKSIELMQKNNYLRKEELPGEYAALYTRLQSLSDFFLASKSDLELAKPSLLKKEFHLLFQYAIYPYLTENAKFETLKKEKDSSRLSNS